MCWAFITIPIMFSYAKSSANHCCTYKLLRDTWLLPQEHHRRCRRHLSYNIVMHVSGAYMCAFNLCAIHQKDIIQISGTCGPKLMDTADNIYTR